MTWRYSKSELAFPRPRLWTWERREKLLLLATLAYVFLLSLLVQPLDEVRSQLLRYGCHRTGKRSRETPTPLYRLRAALSRLWLPVAAASLVRCFLNSGDSCRFMALYRPKCGGWRAKDSNSTT